MKRRTETVVCTVVALLLGVGAGWANAEVVSFQEGFNGYSGTADTFVHTKYSKAINNYGGFGWTKAANPDARFQAGFMRFDAIFGSGAGQIPTDDPGQMIISATLVLHSPQQEVQGSTNQNDATMIADPMTTSWVEGTGNRAAGWAGQAIEGATCGAARHYRADGDYINHPEDTWGLDGLTHMGPTSSDYNTTLRSTHVMEPCDIGAYYDSHFEPLDYFNSIVYDVAEFDVTAAVRAWADGTLDNNGWYMQSSGYNQQYYYTSDYAVDVTGTPENPIDLSLRPELVVEYTPEPATMALLLLGLPAMLKRRKA